MKFYLSNSYSNQRIFGQFALYPLKAIRWQCQVFTKLALTILYCNSLFLEIKIHSESNKFHLTSFTLIPVYYNLNYNVCKYLTISCY